MTSARVLFFSRAILGAFNVLLFIRSSSRVCTSSSLPSTGISGFSLGKMSTLESIISSTLVDVCSSAGSFSCAASDLSSNFNSSSSFDSTRSSAFDCFTSFIRPSNWSFSVSFIKAFTRSSPILSFRTRSISMFFA